MKLRGAGVWVLDGDGEEFEEAARSTGASGGDDRRDDRIAAGSEGPILLDDERMSCVPAPRVSVSGLRLVVHAPLV
jgi:hypothetical protein